MIGMTICSGIGAPEMAAPWIDWRYQSEIEPFPCAVLRARFPGALNLGDMTRFEEWPDANVDVLCGGTPCQDYSVAGKRAGMAGARGGLTRTFVEIARRYRPRWVVWENVPGVLSSNGGRDFAAFLGDLGKCGYGWAYRSLDCEYVRTRRFPFAIPQRRQRVFVVGYLGDWRRAAAVFFDGESLSGNSPPRREAGQAAPTIPSRGSGGGGLGTDFDCDGGLIPEPVAYALPAEGFDASEDGTGRQTLVPEVSPALKARDHKGPSSDGDGDGAPILPVAFDCKGTQVQYSTTGAAPTLRSMGHDGSHVNGGGHAVIAFDTTQITSPGNYSNPQPGDPCHPLAAAGHPPAIAMRWAVRRLTPRECERLMGFPDGHTLIPWRGKPADRCPDGPRYKALGNSWAVNCGEIVFDRIRAVDAMTAGAA